MPHYSEQYKFLVDGKVVISSKGVEWICKNVFKQKYLELLENGIDGEVYKGRLYI